MLMPHRNNKNIEGTAPGELYSTIKKVQKLRGTQN